MKIETPKDLKAIILLCRKLGVESIKIDNIEFHLGDEPVKATRYKQEVQVEAKQITADTVIGGGTLNVSESTKIPVASAWDMLTDEQKLFYSTSTLESNEQ